MHHSSSSRKVATTEFGMAALYGAANIPMLWPVVVGGLKMTGQYENIQNGVVNMVTAPIKNFFGVTKPDDAVSLLPTNTPSTIWPSQQTLAWGASTMLMYKGIELATMLFTQRHGLKQQNELKQRGGQQLVKALADSTTGGAWNSKMFDQMGKEAPTWLKTLPIDNKVFLGGVVAAMATWLHSVGAEEMQKRTTSLVTDYANPKEAGLVSEDSGVLEKFILEKLNSKRLCYGLYRQDPYYTSQTDAAYWKFRPGLYTPVRIIANTMIGLFRETNFIAKDKDPVNAFLVWAELTGYWEVLARLIGLYGWAPVYVASHWVVQIMLAGAEGNDIKKKPTSSYNVQRRKK